MFSAAGCRNAGSGRRLGNTLWLTWGGWVTLRVQRTFRGGLPFAFSLFGLMTSFTLRRARCASERLRWHGRPWIFTNSGCGLWRRDGWPGRKIRERFRVPRPRFLRAGIFLFETLPFQSPRSNGTTIAIDIHVIIMYVDFDRSSQPPSRNPQPPAASNSHVPAPEPCSPDHL